jgi:hypothetical protein
MRVAALVHAVLIAALIPIAAVAADAPPPTGSAVPAFGPWRDPIEGAFTVAVPRGWSASGGLRRASPIDPRSAVELQSPDRAVRVFMGDFGVGAFEVPDRYRAAAGIREGQKIAAGGGAKVTVMRYLTGAEFAQTYIRAKLCRQPQMLQSVDEPDLARALAATVSAANAGIPAQVTARVADVTFKCGSGLGMMRAGTALATPPNGAGIAMWTVPLLAAFVADDPARAELGKYVMNMLLTSFRYDPQWQRGFDAQVRQATGRTIADQNALLQAVQDRARQQASASSLNHANDFKPNSGAVKPADTSGNKRVCDVVGICAAVTTDYSHYWHDYSGNVVAGPESGIPPDNSGVWTRMQ